MKKFIMIFMCYMCTIASGKQAFNYGEKATYNVYWTGIKVGTVVMEVLPKEKDSDDYKFKLTLKTSSFTDKLYKSRQTITSTMNKELTHSKAFAQLGIEQNRKTDKKVEFDWINKKTKYYKNNTLSKEQDLKPGTFDPLSMFYFFRTLPFIVGKKITLTVTDGKRTDSGNIEIIKEEKIKTKPFGKIDTFVLIPELEKIGGIFSNNNKSNMKIWFTNDDTKLPVKIKTKVIVGSFTAELQKVENKK